MKNYRTLRVNPIEPADVGLLCRVLEASGTKVLVSYRREATGRWRELLLDVDHLGPPDPAILRRFADMLDGEADRLRRLADQHDHVENPDAVHGPLFGGPGWP